MSSSVSMRRRAMAVTIRQPAPRRPARARCRRPASRRTLNHAAYSAGTKKIVSTVATVRPPMIAIAIGPQNTLRVSGTIASTVASAVSTTGRVRWMAASSDGVPRIAALRHLDLHLVDQDHRVAHDHAAQRDDAEDRDEAERRLEHQQRRHHADQAERRGQEHHRTCGEKFCSCSIRSSRMVTSITGATASERLVGLVALFHRAAHVDAVARGQLRLDVLQQRADLLRDRHALLAVLDVGAHGDRHVAVAAPQHRLLELVAHLRHLRQRHDGALAGVEVDVLQRVEVRAARRARRGPRCRPGPRARAAATASRRSSRSG